MAWRGDMPAHHGSPDPQVRPLGHAEDPGLPAGGTPEPPLSEPEVPGELLRRSLALRTDVSWAGHIDVAATAFNAIAALPVTRGLLLTGLNILITTLVASSTAGLVVRRGSQGTGTKSVFDAMELVWPQFFAADEVSDMAPLPLVRQGYSFAMRVLVPPGGGRLIVGIGAPAGAGVKATIVLTGEPL